MTFLKLKLTSTISQQMAANELNAASVPWRSPHDLRARVTAPLNVEQCPPVCIATLHLQTSDADIARLRIPADDRTGTVAVIQYLWLNHFQRIGAKLTLNLKFSRTNIVDSGGPVSAYPAPDKIEQQQPPPAAPEPSESVRHHSISPRGMDFAT